MTRRCRNGIAPISRANRSGGTSVGLRPLPRRRGSGGRWQSGIDIDLRALYFAKMTAVTVSSKYQIVIPQEARRKLGISSGTRLQAIPEETGLRLVKEPSIDELPGLLKGMPVQDAEIRNKQDRTLP